MQLQIFKKIIDYALESIVIVEAETLKINYFNHVFVKKLGYNAQEIQQLSLATLTPNYSTTDFKTLLTRAEPKLIVYRHKNGHLVTLKTSLQFIAEPNPWIIATMHEADCCETNILQASYQSQNQFLINIGHKLRTPLHAILGYTQLLTQDRQLNARQQEKVEAVLRNSQQLLSMMEDMITFSKIENQRLTCEVTHFPLKELVNNVVEVFRSRAQQKGLLFLYQELSHLPTIVATDEHKLQQILIHLLDNAIEFTPKGKIIVKIGYHYQQVRFQIEDSGIGIASEDIESIFLPFYQICQEKSSPQGGSGLGLSIAAKLITLLGGQLQVNSVLDQGSTFGFSLALPEVVTPIASTIPPTPYLAQPLNVIIIQDRVQSNEQLFNLLETLGFKVKIFETLQVGDDEPVQLFLIDNPQFEQQRMAHIRQAHPQSRFIALLDSAFDKQQLQESGYDHLLIKPLRAEQLLACLPQALKTTPTEHKVEEHIIAQPYSVTNLGPSPQQARTLYELARKGDINGIFAYMNRLETSVNEPLLPFINHIKKLAYHLEEEKICEIAQYYMDKAP